MRDRILGTLVCSFAILGLANVVGDVSTAQATGGTTVTVTPKVTLNPAALSSATSKQPLPKPAVTKIAPTSPSKSVSVNPAAVKAIPQHGKVNLAPSNSKANTAIIKPVKQGLPTAIATPAPKAPTLNPALVKTAPGALQDSRINDIKARIDPNLHQDLRGVLESAPNVGGIPGSDSIGSSRGDLTRVLGGIGGGDDSASRLPGSSKDPNSAFVNLIPDSTTPRASHGNAGPSESGGAKGGHFLVPTPREAMAGADSQNRGNRGGGNTRSSGIIQTWDGHRSGGGNTRSNGIIQTWDGHRTGGGQDTGGSESNSQVVVTKWQDTGETNKYVDGVEVPDRPQSDTPKVDPAGNPDPTGDAGSPLADALRQRVNIGPAPDLTFKNPNDDTTDPDGRDGAAKTPSAPRLILSQEQLVGDPSLSEAFQASGGSVQPFSPEDADPGPGARLPGRE